MSSILTSHIGKRYLEISDLDGLYNLNYKANLQNQKLNCGYNHSVYIKLNIDQYCKIFSQYVEYTNIKEQDFCFYTNNLVGALLYNSTNDSFTNQCEKWDFVNPSLAFVYDDVDIAYVVDEFTDRQYINAHFLNSAKLRFSSYGNWINLDAQMTMFMGKRILYKHHKKDIEYVSFDSRIENDVD